MSMTYVFASDEAERIKIGSSVAPLKRLRQVNTGSPFELGLAALLEVPEDEAHRALSPYRTHREWFRYCDEVFEYVTAHYFAIGNAAYAICLLEEKVRERGGPIFDDVYVNGAA